MLGVDWGGTLFLPDWWIKVLPKSGAVGGVGAIVSWVSANTYMGNNLFFLIIFELT